MLVEDGEKAKQEAKMPSLEDFLSLKEHNPSCSFILEVCPLRWQVEVMPVLCTRMGCFDYVGRCLLALHSVPSPELDAQWLDKA